MQVVKSAKTGSIFGNLFLLLLIFLIPNFFVQIFFVSRAYGMHKNNHKSTNNIFVDTSGKLCQKEIKYIKKRKPVVKKSQEQLTGKKLSKCPTIGMPFSGGGYRAFVAMLGFMLGAKQIGLLGSTTYISGLSGSAWGIGTLLARNAFYKKKKGFLKKFKQDMQDRMSKSFWNFKQVNWQEIIKRLAKKYKNYGKIEPADLWGALVVDRLMGDLPQSGQNLSFKNIRSFLKKTDKYPYPLFSLIMKDTFDKTEHYEPFEVTPNSSGSDYLHGFVPTKYFGSEFKDGKLTKRRSQESLGFNFGLFGSPYDFNEGDLLLQIVDAIPQTFKFKTEVDSFVRFIIKKYKLSKKNFLPSKVNNPTYNMKTSSYKKEFLTLADAGFEFNLTIPPLLRRKPNIIVCCDASSDACEKGFPELVIAKEYADKNGFAFPSLKYYKKISANLFIFKWDKSKKTNKKIPAILYFTNPISESTFKLEYSKKEFNKLCDSMKKMVIKHKDTIAKEIIEKSL
ncbi:hypothetical protein ACFLYU_02515 [Candidatus Dependentiae bacterium]